MKTWKELSTELYHSGVDQWCGLKGLNLVENESLVVVTWRDPLTANHDIVTRAGRIQWITDHGLEFKPFHGTQWKVVRRCDFLEMTMVKPHQIAETIELSKAGHDVAQLFTWACTDETHEESLKRDFAAWFGGG